MKLYTHKQLELEIDRRLHEEFLRRSMENEINELNKRIVALEDRVRTLEYRVCPENVLTNTGVKA